MKLAAALTLGLALTLTLSACGGGGDGGGAPAPTPHPARASGSLFFDGADDRVTIPNAVWGTTPLGAGLTIEAWIRPETLTADPAFAGIVKPNSHALTLSNNAGGNDQSAFAMVISVPGTNNARSGVGTLQTGVWQHVAGTYDGGTIRLYLNGAEIATQVHPGTATSMTEVEIGMWSTSFHGAIDEVRIWEGVRTAPEIAGNMNAAVPGATPGLLGYYRFEGTGQTAVDTSVRGANGSLGTTNAAEGTDPTRIPN